MDQYVLHALEARRLSPAELARLEDLIASARQQGRRKGKEGSK
jgi:hypothetical protein